MGRRGQARNFGVQGVPLVPLLLALLLSDQQQPHVRSPRVPPDDAYWQLFASSQAATMRLDNLPNDVISNLDPLGLIIFIPIFDLLIYPLLSRNGIRFTPIKKITLGFATGTGAMICAAIVQNAIYQQSTCGQFAGECDTTVGISVWAQTPSYVLIAISEILASITGLEYAYTKAPTSMRSLVVRLLLLGYEPADILLRRCQFSSSRPPSPPPSASPLYPFQRTRSSCGITDQ